MSAGIWGPLCKVPGARDRLLADPSFMVKVGIEVIIGIAMKARDLGFGRTRDLEGRVLADHSVFV